MSPDLPNRVVHAVEHVCNLGCRRVHEIIRDMESGRAPDEIEDLADSDRRRVLVELKQIMAVYKNSSCKS